jgi:hypothetical protein
VEVPNDRQIVDLPQPSRMFGIDIHILDVIESTISLEGACNGGKVLQVTHNQSSFQVKAPDK